MLVRAPASSANLGPGFDCLALALDLPFWFAAPDAPDSPDAPSTGSAGAVAPDAGRVPPSLPAAARAVGGEGSPARMLAVESTHPAAVAWRSAGGDPAARLWWRSPIPPGRGQGFSGAARVAGAFAARRSLGDPADVARRGAREVASQLEGHSDNAAASALGGLTVSAGDHDVTVLVPDGLEVELWWPVESVGTDLSRAQLQPQVPLEDAAFSVARASMWVAALAGRDFGALRTACEDRLHQPGRLADLPGSLGALQAFLDDREVLAAWLSGSGPTIAALVPVGHEVQGSFPTGQRRRVGVDRAGVVEAPTK